VRAGRDELKCGARFVVIPIRGWSIPVKSDEGQAIQQAQICSALQTAGSPRSRKPWLAVVKRSGVTEPFSRERSSGASAGRARGRRWTRTRWHRLAQAGGGVDPGHRVRRDPQPRGRPGHPRPVARAGEVAYLRFASVYRSFSSIEDFEKEIADLRTVIDEATSREDRRDVTRQRRAKQHTLAGPHRTGSPDGAGTQRASDKGEGLVMTETVGTPATTGSGDGLHVSRVYTTKGVHPL